LNCKETTNYQKYSLTTYDSTERYPRSVLRFPKDVQKSAVHPTQKPVALIEYLIKSYSNPNDTVLDMCAGSMTTAIAAVNTGRHYICFEKDPDIFLNGVKRFNESTNGGYGQ
jgi:site-specific DNA-methyltransferase (adenine-specific)